MEIHLKIIGVLLILLALLHIIFPRYFNWTEELKNLSLMNRQMMVVHTFFIGLILALMGMLCLISSAELIHSSLGRKICLGMGIFWIIRLYVQFFVYSPELWKGKSFETTIHYSFSLLWTYLSSIFLFAYFIP